MNLRSFFGFGHAKPMIHNIKRICLFKSANYIGKNCGIGFFFFFFSRAFLTARRSKGTGLFYWAASRHRLFIYWPVSRCACGREGISPDLPLPGWEATARHSWAGEGEEVAEGWKVSVGTVVGTILKMEDFADSGIWNWSMVARTTAAI